MPTSRYCDHAPCAISASLRRAASGEPGRTEARSSPMIATIERRTLSALAGSPRACSSMTRSSMLDTNVTPAALSACRSQGASSHGFDASRVSCGVFASRSASVPTLAAPVAPRTRACGMLELEQRAARRRRRCERSKTSRAANSDQRGPLDRRQVGAADENRFRRIRRQRARDAQSLPHRQLLSRSSRSREDSARPPRAGRHAAA